MRIWTEPLAESLTVRPTLDEVWLRRSSNAILRQSVAARLMGGILGLNEIGILRQYDWRLRCGTKSCWS